MTVAADPAKAGFLLDRDDAEEFTESLGQIAAGSYRQVALGVRLGVPQALGLSVNEWVQDRLGGYVRMAIPGRREAVMELVAPEEDGGMGMSNRQAADVLGISPATVNRDVAAIEATEARDGALDKPSSPPGASNEAPKTTRELLAQSDQNDWRTPRKFIDAARNVLREIDLDPASSPEANETVKANLFYIEEDDGLSQPWAGRVWLNPPYGGQARLFVERLIREYEVGNVTAACLLVNSHPTETKWFQELFRHTVCFIRGRIDFGGPSRAVSSTSTHGSAIVYLGEEPDRFAHEFRQFGAVVRSIS